MANKRVSELNELLASGVEQTDLFLITDVSAFESKRIRASQWQAYVLSGTASWANNSFSSSYALHADSASWAPVQVSASYALSASYADWAKTASYVISASYALSSSWANNSFFSVTASYAMTSSVNLVISSGMATQAETASYLLYTPGLSNGTASWAITASRALESNSSSFLIYSPTNGSASYAVSSSRTISSSYSLSSSYLNYTGAGSNGTASYAISSSLAQRARFVQRPMAAGMISATTTPSASLISMSLARSDGFFSLTYITFTGNAQLSYTGSVSGSLTLAVYNRNTTATLVYDVLPITCSTNGANPISCSITQPITLQGVVNLVNGEYNVYVTSSLLSPGVTLDISRTSKFRIDSESDSVIAY